MTELNTITAEEKDILPEQREAIRGLYEGTKTKERVKGNWRQGILIGVLLGVLLGGAAVNYLVGSKSGRYQITSASPWYDSNNRVLYLLDTETGNIWVREKNAWKLQENQIND